MTLASKLQRNPGRSWIALLTSALLLYASSAHAEDAETRTAARDLATQGAQAFEAGHYAEAADFFKRAHELVHAPSIALLEARSWAKLGKLLEAVDIFEQTARFKLSEASPEAYAQAVESAHNEVEEVRKRVPRLKLTLVGGVPSEETPLVTIDDKPTPAALLGVERPINPGLHSIVVRVAGQVRSSRELSLLETESYQVQLDVSPAKPAPQPVVFKEPPVAAAAPSNASSSTMRTVGYVSIGVGVLGLGIGTYTGLVALHHKSGLDSACNPKCPVSSADDLDGFRSNRTVSWISYGVGIAAGATGVLLLTLGKPAHESVAIRAFPNGILIGGQL
ncbi:MAG: hypothetical protein ABIQ16_22120 [Polyangiaceae bacterium]